jgi:hypothetical protein
MEIALPSPSVPGLKRPRRDADHSTLFSLVLFNFTPNGFAPCGSGTTIRHNTQKYTYHTKVHISHKITHQAQAKHITQKRHITQISHQAQTKHITQKRHISQISHQAQTKHITQKNTYHTK